jgi:type I restriction enzyme M protein
MGFLEQKHIDKIFKAYIDFTDKKQFAALMTTKDVLSKNGNMAINLYVRPEQLNSLESISFEDAYQTWENSSKKLKSSMNELFKVLG